MDRTSTNLRLVDPLGVVLFISVIFISKTFTWNDLSFQFVYHLLEMLGMLVCTPPSHLYMTNPCMYREWRRLLAAAIKSIKYN